MASCELLGLHGQQHGKIRLGTMLHQLKCIVSHRPISPKAKLRINKAGKNQVIFGCCNGQKFLKRKKKSPDLPYLLLLSTYLARNM